MRYRKDQPKEAPPGQSLGTRAAIVGEKRGEDPETRDPVIAVIEGPQATGRKVQAASA